jgi:hypothetical protein
MSWLQGCLVAMTDALKKQEDARTQQTSTALMVIDTALSNNFQEFLGKSKKVATKSGLTNRKGYADGTAAGKDLHIGQKEIE